MNNKPKIKHQNWNKKAETQTKAEQQHTNTTHKTTKPDSKTNLQTTKQTTENKAEDNNNNAVTNKADTQKKRMNTFVLYQKQMHLYISTSDKQFTV